MSSKKKKVIRNLLYENFLIRFDEGANVVSLTDLWKAAGKPKSKRPVDWRELDATQELLYLYAEQSAVTALCSEKGFILELLGMLLICNRGGKHLEHMQFPNLLLTTLKNFLLNCTNGHSIVSSSASPPARHHCMYSQ